MRERLVIGFFVCCCCLMRHKAVSIEEMEEKTKAKEPEKNLNTRKNCNQLITTTPNPAESPQDCNCGYVMLTSQLLQ